MWRFYQQRRSVRFQSPVALKTVAMETTSQDTSQNFIPKVNIGISGRVSLKYRLKK